MLAHQKERSIDAHLQRSYNHLSILGCGKCGKIRMDGQIRIGVQHYSSFLTSHCKWRKQEAKGASQQSLHEYSWTFLKPSTSFNWTVSYWILSSEQVIGLTCIACQSKGTAIAEICWWSRAAIHAVHALIAEEIVDIVKSHGNTLIDGHKHPTIYIMEEQTGKALWE